MRVIAGSLKGRNIHETRGHKTHPMSEKIRGALFNALGDIEGLTIFDAFAGTGAVGIEAISRGAASVQAVDSDKEAARTIQRNVNKLGLREKIAFSQANVSSWLDNNLDSMFDIVIADPPYDNVINELICKVSNSVKIGGVFVASIPSSIQIELSSNFTELSSKVYGEARLVFYRRFF